MRCNGSNWAVYSPGSWDGFRNDVHVWALWAGVIMRLEHHLVGGYVHILLLLLCHLTIIHPILMHFIASQNLLISLLVVGYIFSIDNTNCYIISVCFFQFEFGAHTLASTHVHVHACRATWHTVAWPWLARQLHVWQHSVNLHTTPYCDSVT